MNFKKWLINEDNPLTIAKKDWPSIKLNPDKLAELPPENVWFHGSGEDFEHFKIAGIKRRVSHWNNLLGIHFTADPIVASNVAAHAIKDKPASSKKYVYEVDLNVKNPINFASEKDMDVQALQLAYKDGVINKSDLVKTISKPKYIEEGGSWSDRQGDIEDLVFKWADLKADPILNSLGNKRPAVAKHFKNHLKSLGYDGIIYKSSYSSENYATCVIVFEESQITILAKKIS